MSMKDLTLLDISRAVQDLRAGVPVLLADKKNARLVIAAELADNALLKQLRAYGDAPRLVITATHARGLGVAAAKPVAIEEVSLHQVKALVTPQRNQKKKLATVIADVVETAALQLAKEAALLPAIISVPVKEKYRKKFTPIRTDDVMRYRETQAASLRPVTEARLPLKAHADAKVIVFRPRFGAVEHLAILIGKINKTPLVRVHSSCITGDLLGSLRCDCGDQLKLALDAIGQAGGGVLVYLSQEGRGIGIVSKLRAYGLQDAGLDTMEANEALGFDVDEREFASAAVILKQLGIRQVQLMTNNPLKISELKRHGITVVKRVPLVAPRHAHNERYLKTKAEKAGHQLR